MSDRADAALRDWAARVRANRDQAERLRETPPGGDFYAPVSSVFAADPRRTDDEILDALRALAVPGETWLDIGAGAGRYALPLALRLAGGGAPGRVIAVDPSPSMLAGLRDGMAQHGIANVEPIEGRWPLPSAAPALAADVALIAHVSYDIEELGPFLDAMEGASRRACVAVLATSAPSTMAAPLWPAVHGEERAELPALEAFVGVLRARGRTVDVRRFEGSSRTYGSRDDLLRWARNQTFVEVGSAADRRLEAEVDRCLVEDGSGVRLAHAVPLDLGLVKWSPR